MNKYADQRKGIIIIYFILILRCNEYDSYTRDG